MNQPVYQVHITVENDQDIQPELIDLVKILWHLRYHTKEWEAEYGFENKRRKKVWEGRADKWLEKNVHIQPSDLEK